MTVPENAESVQRRSSRRGLPLVESLKVVVDAIKKGDAAANGAVKEPDYMASVKVEN